MATSLALILILGLLFHWLFTKIKLPGLLGMLLLGVLLGPFGLNFLDARLLETSGDFRKIALIIILLRAGFGVSRDELTKIGPTAFKMSCIPGLFEGFAIALISVVFLDFTWIQGGILGFIIAAVSPAVVVPQMLFLSEQRLGTNKGIPTIILAGASIDDVFAITLFTAFMGLYAGSKVPLGMQLLNIPISIILGIALGILLGLLLVKLFKTYHIRDTKKTLLLLGSAILLTTLETELKGKLEIASLLGVMTIGFIILERLPHVAKRLAVRFNKIWLFAELLLFVLVGAQVNIQVAWHAGLLGLLVISFGLIARSLGVVVSLLGTPLNAKERLFCVIAYIPKATVQAAIGSLPLAAGVASGEIILAIAVLSIVVTAPLGAIAIKASAPHLLSEEAPTAI